jgi:hypothetical protein
MTAATLTKQYVEQRDQGYWIEVLVFLLIQ